MPSSQRAALWLWYRGTHFRGWQRQAQGPTVQEAVGAQLKAAGVAGGLAAAGRTDRGVHARQQVASVRVPADVQLQALGNGLVAADWGCAAIAAAPAGFHAQWTPSRKEYRYRLSSGPPPPGWDAYSWNLGGDSRLTGAPVHPTSLGEVLAAAVGTRDFAAFHAASSLRRLRTLSGVELRPVAQAPGLWELRVHGAGFGRYQVRGLVGAAALVASGQLSPRSWREALAEATPFRGMLAPAQGLILWAVDYTGQGPFDAPFPARLPTGPPFETP